MDDVYTSVKKDFPKIEEQLRDMIDCEEDERV